ncbi:MULTISPECIES: HipA domain-containing protein [Vibrio]|uniref:Phosphatidylinositol kinase n=1 Tax=Vibrio tasmaniensis TaxID=212663 RepID=A0A2N7NEC8_9VIBR|nr:HipA domain-containing protein [Vibrio tasmaniensis]PMP11398.1 phosphatidylinositol kinase [Vibrio tasmaniensis]TKG35120.1 type II toxin-antitoxin system HipA family toxin [Vibrio tasmaniensis]TKG40333.1 type II toxin-antitoxin system HipA family toxin [Vibrio tasmaniensis]TKG47862.1 type II toxin-antitoxin system HipA family toxin [Vibrio tasmaniensis]TKG48567.1 type II toxin-antitoxin system HipA family toxin [Vibrio tasmaniensis]
MTSGSNQYILDIVYSQQVIGKLSLSKESDALSVIYKQDWIDNGFPISPHLPFNSDIPSVNIRRFLQNLLPENKGLDYLIDFLGVSRSNVFAQVGGIGTDTSGAMMFLSEGVSPVQTETSFNPINDSELIKKLSDPELWYLEIWEGKPRLSVAGVQSKLNVLSIDGNLGFGEGELCSTHIVKFEKNDQQHLVINEFVTMKLAKLVELDVADVELRYFDQFPALIVERFDRKLFSSTSVKRRHMIDACQACNLGVDRKYERNLGKQRDVSHIRDGVSFTRLFSVTEQCENPLAAKLAILKWAMFNLCIYNADAHGKNFSFFVQKSGLTPTPLYDLVNVRMYPEFEQDLAMAIGDEFDSDSINAYQLVEFADDCGISPKLLQQSLVKIANDIINNIDDAISLVTPTSDSQLPYLNRYREIVVVRCKHFLKQSPLITEIEL